MLNACYLAVWKHCSSSFLYPVRFDVSEVTTALLHTHMVLAFLGLRGLWGMNTFRQVPLRTWWDCLQTSLCEDVPQNHWKLKAFHWHALRNSGRLAKPARICRRPETFLFGRSDQESAWLKLHWQTLKACAGWSQNEAEMLDYSVRVCGWDLEIPIWKTHVYALDMIVQRKYRCCLNRSTQPDQPQSTILDRR